MDVPSNPDTVKFQELLHTSGLKQHVTDLTSMVRCVDKHCVDLLLTRESEASEVMNIEVRNDHIADHKTVYFTCNLRKPNLPKKTILFRKIRSIDINDFRDDIVSSGLPSADGELEYLVSFYNKTLSNILDKHAPLKTKTVTIHPTAKWMNDEVRAAKSAKRKAERKWRKTNLEVHRQIYISMRDDLNVIINNSKQDHIQKTISESDNDQRALFRTMDDLFYNKKSTASSQSV